MTIYVAGLGLMLAVLLVHAVGLRERAGCEEMRAWAPYLTAVLLAVAWPAVVVWVFVRGARRE